MIRSTKQFSAPGPFVGKTGGGTPPDLTPYLKHAGYTGNSADLQSYFQGLAVVDAPAGSFPGIQIPPMTVGGVAIPAARAAFPGYSWRMAPNDSAILAGFDLNPANPNGYGIALFFASDDNPDAAGSQGFLFASGNPLTGQASDWNNVLFMSPDYGYQFFLLPSADVLGTDADGKLIAKSLALSSPFGQELFPYSTSETEGAIGQNGTINANPANGTRGFAFIPSGTVQINKMRVQITQTTASNMRLGIYDASGNRVAQTARFSPVLGINTVSLAASAVLTGGTIYFMAYWTDDATANVRFKLLSGRSVGTAQPLDQRSDPNEMPVSIGSGLTNTQYRPWLQISG